MLHVGFLAIFGNHLLVLSADTSTDWAYSIKGRPFFRTLSYREFFTGVTLSLFLLAVVDAIDYLFDGAIDRNLVTGFLVITLPFVSHILYRLEHKRSNNFMGRNLNDYLLLISMFLVIQVRNLIRDGELHLPDKNVAEIFVFLFVVAFWIMVMEICISLFKRLLRLIRWRIL